MYTVHTNVYWRAGPPREGGMGYNDPGAHGLWGAHGLQEGSKGAHQMTFRNEHVRSFFWRSPDFDQKKTLEFR